jgi:hypothetical protein
MASVSSLLTKSVHQLTSKELANQAELALLRRAEPNAMPVEVIRSKRTQGAAFTLACDSSGLDDKEIYLQLGIDAGTFSRIKKGTNTLSNDLLRRFCDIVSNTVYAEWLAYQVGGTVVMIQSEAERQLAERDARIAKLEERLRIVEDLAVRRMNI